MSDTFLLLGNLDRLCGQFAAALQHAEWQLYATLALILVLSALLFPSRNDPDQVASPFPRRNDARVAEFVDQT
jgi:hypothetical protein